MGTDVTVPKLESAWNARSGAAVAGAFTPEGLRVEYALPGARLEGRGAITARARGLLLGIPGAS